MISEVIKGTWLKKIAIALIGAILGPTLIISAFAMVFWNEGNGLDKAIALKQVGNTLISIPASPINKHNNNQVVYLTGLATTSAILDDKLFGVSENAIKLQRHVEMYQWQQKLTTNADKTKTYTYQKIWSDKIISSNLFKEKNLHNNPTALPLTSNIQYAAVVKVGDFLLPKEIIEKIDEVTPVNLSRINQTKLKTLLNKNIHQDGDNLYFGNNPNNPEVGDITVSINKTPATTISIIAEQSNNHLQPYLTPAGETIYLVNMGQVAAHAMLHDALGENTVLTWGFRLLALIAIMLGIGLIIQMINIVTNKISHKRVITFITGILLWIIAMAIAWFAVKPIFTTSMVIVIILLLNGYRLIRKNAVH